MASSLAEMAGLPGEVLQAAKRFGFALSQGNQSHTLAGEMLKAAERLRRKDLYVNAMEEDRGNRSGRRPGGVIRAPPKPGIPGLRSSP